MYLFSIRYRQSGGLRRGSRLFSSCGLLLSALTPAAGAGSRLSIYFLWFSYGYTPFLGYTPVNCSVRDGGRGGGKAAGWLCLFRLPTVPPSPEGWCCSGFYTFRVAQTQPLSTDFRGIKARCAHWHLFHGSVDRGFTFVHLLKQAKRRGALPWPLIKFWEERLCTRNIRRTMRCRTVGRATMHSITSTAESSADRNTDGGATVEQKKLTWTPCR